MQCLDPTVLLLSVGCCTFSCTFQVTPECKGGLEGPMEGSPPAKSPYSAPDHQLINTLQAVEDGEKKHCGGVVLT
jgi:hypothetical protein